MPKKTEHRSCVKCGSRSQVCAYTGFYLLTSKTETRGKSKAQTQVTGTLPARGFCSPCFLRYAKKQGWGEEVILKLRRKLKRSNSNEP